MGIGPGSKLGPYQVVAPLGAGGMGEVYRVRDTRLHRDGARAAGDGGAVHLTRQIADALEAAPEQGVIHRDLNPRTSRSPPDRNVKVLDFGLAKLASVEESLSSHSSALSLSPTMTSPALVTGAAVLLGTAGSMAQEKQFCQWCSRAWNTRRITTCAPSYRYWNT